LDDVRIYDQALAEEAIAALMNDYALATAEAGYRMAVYQALLKQIGTSYEEIRLARSAAATRRELAERLGVALDAVRPDQLALLYLPPERISEAGLETLFGLVATTRDPLQPAPAPQLLTWRMDYLHNLWQEQDWPADPYIQRLLP